MNASTVYDKGGRKREGKENGRKKERGGRKVQRKDRRECEEIEKKGGRMR